MFWVAFAEGLSHVCLCTKGPGDQNVCLQCDSGFWNLLLQGIAGRKGVWRAPDCLGHGSSGSGGWYRMNLHFSQVCVCWLLISEAAWQSRSPVLDSEMRFGAQGSISVC